MKTKLGILRVYVLATDNLMQIIGIGRAGLSYRLV